jgi:hypothetical protein
MISFPGTAQGVKFTGSAASAAAAPAQAVCINLNFNFVFIGCFAFTKKVHGLLFDLCFF